VICLLAVRCLLRKLNERIVFFSDALCAGIRSLRWRKLSKPKPRVLVFITGLPTFAHSPNQALPAHPYAEPQFYSSYGLAKAMPSVPAPGNMPLHTSSACTPPHLLPKHAGYTLRLPRPLFLHAPRPTASAF